ncbi:MAG TPA: ABC transporter substrate-binding protein, partial [candidate division Zixibacteria bacterium]|nr:ABC transporter substrate-binding protein [candidate division Zixibacteria bacterium]
RSGVPTPAALALPALRRLCGLALAFSAALAAPVTAPAQQAARRIIVVQPSDGPSYTRLARGVESHFKRSDFTVSLATITAADLDNQSRRILDSVRAIAPDLIVTIGSGITRLMADSITDIPIVFAGVFNPELSGFVASRSEPGGNVTGASLDIPPDKQFKYFRQVAPHVKKLGIIHSSETAPLIPHARVVAQDQGIELVAVEVTSDARGGYERGVYAALDSLLPQVDGLWSLADHNVITPVSVKLIVKSALQHNVPFMGFSNRVVSSGALFALEFDYKDIGRQVGELAERALRGESAGAIPVTDPGVIWFMYNENTARRLEMEIPEELRAIAKEVYK